LIAIIVERSFFLGIEHELDIVHRGIKPSGDVAIGRLKTARPRHLHIEISREPGAIGVEGMHLLAEDGSRPFHFERSIDRRFELIQRLGQTPGDAFGDRRIVHGPSNSPGSPNSAWHDEKD
jgi:hypothetical protein